MTIENQVEKQRQYFLQGETLDYNFRLLALKKLLSTINNMEEEITIALKEDLNKSEIESFLTEIDIVYKELDYTIKNLKKWMKKEKVKTPLSLFPAKSYRLPEPYGVTLIMSPWNYPFMLTIAPLIGAIAAGNCVIIKPSAYAPSVALLIKKLINNCFDEKYCLVVLGSRQENTELLNQKFDYIFFTGSVNVGKIVMAAASKHLTPITLELGGKSPVIVDKTADLDLTAKRIVFGKYLNAGQTCVAPDYVLVHKNQKEILIEKLNYYIKKFYPQDNLGNVLDYPKIISEKHFERLIDLLQNEKIVIGGNHNIKNLSIEPTVLDDISFNSLIMQEEIFGPILPLIEYEDLNLVLNEIKARPKPLALYLFSNDKLLIQEIEKTISYGGGCINDCLLHVASSYLPFGGVGESGMGAYHGKASFKTFSHYKGIVNKGTKIDLEMRYRPYDEKKNRLLRKI